MFPSFLQMENKYQQAPRGDKKQQPFLIQSQFSHKSETAQIARQIAPWKSANALRSSEREEF